MAFLQQRKMHRNNGLDHPQPIHSWTSCTIGNSTEMHDRQSSCPYHPASTGRGTHPGPDEAALQYQQWLQQGEGKGLRGLFRCLKASELTGSGKDNWKCNSVCSKDKKTGVSSADSRHPGPRATGTGPTELQALMPTVEDGTDPALL